MIDIVKHAAEQAGSITKLALALKISPQAIHQWKKIPAERVIEIERISGVPRQELRPDLYPNEAA